MSRIKIFSLNIIFSIFFICICICNSDAQTNNQSSDSNNYSFQIPVPTGYVNDYAGLFTDEQKDSLTSIISEHEKQTTNQIAIAIFDTLKIPTDSFDSYTLHIFNNWGVGQKDKNNGVLITICLKMRMIRIQNGYGIEKKLSDSETKQIIDSIIIPEFKNGDFYEGTKKAVLAIIKKIT